MSDRANDLIREYTKAVDHAASMSGMGERYDSAKVWLAIADRELRDYGRTLLEGDAGICLAKCDHGSECLRLHAHVGPHETQHGCVFYDEVPR